MDNFDPVKETLKPSLVEPEPPISTSNLSHQLHVYEDLPQTSDKDLQAVRAQQRLANYIAAAMIFLKDNVLLQQELTKEHIKSALLGHWGTCPALSLVYAHANLLIRHTDVDMIMVTGPGHGAPSILANLWIEGALATFYSKYAMNSEGLRNLVRGFSWPGGFPSHVNAELPGQIHEGGELGYALSVAYGAVMDKPDMICICVVGDGEAETGPTATSWHSHKFIDPAESGAVLPVLNLNGYKISERTIYGCMSDSELASLFSGFGYEPLLVDSIETINEDLSRAFIYAYNRIRRIQSMARSDPPYPFHKPRWPMVLLRTPKGYTGPRSVHGHLIEGTYKAHQVPLPNAKSDDEEFSALRSWLKSYKVEELLDVKTAQLSDSVKKNIPRAGKLMGEMECTYKGAFNLNLPDWKDFAVDVDRTKRIAEQVSATEKVAEFCSEVIRKNPDTFRIFSPDELCSNKLDAVLKVTNRNFQWEEESWHKGGRVIEVLSEHLCQGFAQGYALTGRHALFPSYESFLGIVTTMMVQYAKFIKIAMETTWRQPVPSFNYIESSTLWRQEHNGFSHQNPGFINSLLNMKGSVARIYLPPDANTFICLMAHCMRRKNHINLLIGGKRPSPVWLTPSEAEDHCRAGASVWKFASCDNSEEPDVVLVGCGNETMYEVVAGAEEFRKMVPGVKIRVVNVVDFMSLCDPSVHRHGLSKAAFEALFTKDRPVVFNFHGYPSAVNQVLADRKSISSGQFSVHGYREEGTTTTPFDLLAANGCSRFDLIIDALRSMAVNPRKGTIANPDTHTLIKQCEGRIKDHHEWVIKEGRDPDWVLQGIELSG